MYSGSIGSKQVTSGNKYIVYCPECGVVNSSSSAVSGERLVDSHNVFRHPIKTLIKGLSPSRLYGHYRGDWVDVTDHKVWRKMEKL
jgi:hypothetical protein